MVNYKRRKKIKAIDYSANVDSHVLSSEFTKRFKTIMGTTMIKL